MPGDRETILSLMERLASEATPDLRVERVFMDWGFPCILKIRSDAHSKNEEIAALEGGTVACLGDTPENRARVARVAADARLFVESRAHVKSFIAVVKAGRELREAVEAARAAKGTDDPAKMEALGLRLDAAVKGFDAASAALDRPAGREERER
jgi:hypothetical protein